MSSRLFGLHLRARGVPAAMVGLVAGSLAAWQACRWLLDRAVEDPTGARRPVAVLAPLLLAAVLAATLAGADEQLERSTAVPWRAWRLVHAVAVLAACAGSGASIALQQPRDYGAWVLVRGGLGLTGLVMAAASLVGTQVAALPALTWLIVTMALVVPPQPPSSRVWAWPAWPSDVPVTWAAAAVCALLGVGLHAWRGARA